MLKKSLDRYEEAPAEGEIYDPKGHRRLRLFRRWAKLATVLMALVLFVTVIVAIMEEDPMPFFAVFFSFVLTLGVVGIMYDKKLDQHKTKVLNAKIRERQAIVKAANSRETSVPTIQKTSASA